MKRTAALCLLLLTPACVRIGARSVQHDRFDYNVAIARTQDEQMLLNLVRLRYLDTPMFLQVGSVSTQYSLEAGADLGVTVPEGGPDSFRAGTGLAYGEKPTVTYSPLAGDDFVRQMLSPIPFDSLMLLTRSGWSIERILRCCVQEINGLRNAPTASGPTPSLVPDHREFREAARILRNLQIERAVTLEITPGAGGNEFVLRVDEARAGDHLGRLRSLLGLSGRASSFRLVAGDAGGADGGSARLVTRSLIGVLFYLSNAVEPPPRDVEAGVVGTTRAADGAAFDWREVTGGLFRVRSADERPARAFVAVRYRGAWFYVDDADRETKSTFGLLTHLFNLQAGSQRSVSPLLTLPVGS